MYRFGGVGLDNVGDRRRGARRATLRARALDRAQQATGRKARNKGVSVSAGDRSWEPFDRQAKAIRTLQTPRPVYLGPKLLVMTSPPENVWVFTKP